ncbi:hypothetical protein [Glycomyces sp. MUSA5-2]|uniref:hypothetical protein n=1 Tax=Glycomyces sp. MUSA5-2 TaxID=2053002 RepID=UPI00300820C4
MAGKAQAPHARTGAPRRELDRVLAPLAGRALYRDNVFRITGLPSDATPRQVRRAREERTNPYYEPPAATRDAPLPPSTDPDEVHHAFEGLRDPLARLVHELLWLRPNLGPDHHHNAAVRTHCAAIEAAAAGEAAPALWAAALASWDRVFADRDTWRWARQRVRAIDDPRLDVDVVTTLKTRLPELIAAVSFALAAAAAADGDTDAAARHVAHLDEAGFREGPVKRARRAAVAPAEARVKAACEAAVERGDGAGLKAVQALLSDTAEPLRVIEALLGRTDPLSRACRDEVAGTANRCAVGYFNKRRKDNGVSRVLERARTIAASDAVAALIDDNLAVVKTEPILGTVEPLLKQNRIDAAAARLRAWHRFTKDPVRKAALAEILADPRRLCGEIREANLGGCLFFFGAKQYGARDHRSTTPGVRTHVTTLYLTFLWIPLVPLSAHIVGYDTATWGRVYGGRVPLSGAARVYRVLFLIAAPALIALRFAGPGWALWTAAMAGAVAAVALCGRALSFDAWARKQEAAR